MKLLAHPFPSIVEPGLFSYNLSFNAANKTCYFHIIVYSVAESDLIDILKMSGSQKQVV